MMYELINEITLFYFFAPITNALCRNLVSKSILRNGITWKTMGCFSNFYHYKGAFYTSF